MDAVSTRQARKDLGRIESQLGRLDQSTARLHTQMASAGNDYSRLAELQAELTGLAASKDELELAWMGTAEKLD